MSGMSFSTGEIVPMAGGTVLHAALCRPVRSRRCTRATVDDAGPTAPSPYSGAGLGASDLPDVTIVCGPIETDPNDTDTVMNPSCRRRVLSPSTIDYDLGERGVDSGARGARQCTHCARPDTKEGDPGQRGIGGNRSDAVGVVPRLGQRLVLALRLLDLAAYAGASIRVRGKSRAMMCRREPI